MFCVVKGLRNAVFAEVAQQYEYHDNFISSSTISRSIVPFDRQAGAQEAIGINTCTSPVSLRQRCDNIVINGIDIHDLTLPCFSNFILMVVQTNVEEEARPLVSIG
ncbi:hypothetical protein TELCIR_17089 [Teladorsagia circumcincta]|uniref:Uncharacterized protein n=1 Tax=Teladorsagia circumcincta TaxID=45464 RepID=A0A2G9TU09_TELCI|nr:hypothetical protein TELCIR_17089 [Teladorsagia circumcincta]